MKILTLLLLVLAVGCRSMTTPAEAQAAPPEPVVAVAPEPPPAAVEEDEPAPTPTPLPPPTEQDYRDLVARIQTETEAIRGIEVEDTIEPKILDREELSELLQKMLTEELEKPGALEYVEVMKMLDILAPEVSIEETYQNLLEGQVGGLYNPTDRSLYVVDTFDPRGFIGNIILSHEIGHALQDKEHNLQEFLMDEENVDRQKAKHAVVEGDATVLMIEWGADNFTPAVLLELTTLMQQQSQDLAAVPQVLVQDLLFAYLGGAEFCNAVQRAHPEDWRTKIFVDPPTSTEQILHPEKYLAEERDEPFAAELKKLAEDSPYEEAFRNTMGEWAIRLFLTPPEKFPKIGAFTLNPMVNYQPAITAGTGWGGDQWVLLKNRKDPEDTIFVWKTTWDTHEDAVEFTQAVTARFKDRERYGVPSPMIGTAADPAERHIYFEKAENPIMILQTHRRVDIVIAPSVEKFSVGKELLPKTEHGPNVIDKNLGAPIQ